VSNTYAKSGTYTVTLSVQSEGGQTAIATKTIKVTLPSRGRGVRH
jgi:PKD repeat protein